MEIIEKNESIIEYKINLELEDKDIEASPDSTRSLHWRTTASGSYILTCHLSFTASVKESKVMLISYRSRLELEFTTETEEKDLEDISRILQGSTDSMITFITQNSLSYAPILRLEHFGVLGPRFESLKNSYLKLKSLPRYNEKTEKARNIELSIAKLGQHINISFNN